MGQIGIIPASATETFNIQNLPEFILMGTNGDIHGAMEVTISGEPTFIVSDRTLSAALAAIGNAGDLNNFFVSKLQQIANGGVGNKNVSLRITNPTAAPLPIFGFSTSKNDGTAVKANQSVVVSSSNVVAIDNRLGFIQSARIYGTTGGNVTVAKKSYMAIK
jgi:hypothetical protein